MKCIGASAQRDLARTNQAFHRVQEIAKPAPVVNPFTRTGPASKLFSVIGEHGQAMARCTKVAHVLGNLTRQPKWNQISKTLVDREHVHALPVAFGAPRNVQLLALKSADEKMPVIHENVPDACVSEIGGKLRFPYPLGEPESAGGDAKAGLDSLAHPDDLFDAIGARKRSEQRLVVAGEQHLDLAGRRQLANHVEIFRVTRLEPLQ